MRDTTEESTFGKAARVFGYARSSSLRGRKRGQSTRFISYTIYSGKGRAEKGGYLLDVVKDLHTTNSGFFGRFSLRNQGKNADDISCGYSPFHPKRSIVFRLVRFDQEVFVNYLA